MSIDFEKALRETQSEETFKIISSSEEEFRNWLERLKEIAEEYGKSSFRNGMLAKKARRIADFYGYEQQSMVLQEECAELIQAVSKYHRFPNMDAQDNMVEELADVQVMINQMRYLLDVYPNIFHEKMMYKLDRQLERIGEYE